MLFGADRRAAAEFSFWLAMPTMVGAFAFEAYKNRAELVGGNTMLIAIGFAVSFVCGWFVVKTFLGYVSRHGFGAVRLVANRRRRARPDRAGARHWRRQHDFSVRPASTFPEHALTVRKPATP